MAIFRHAFAVVLLFCYCNASCLSTLNKLPCSGRGSCVSDECHCNIGFSGNDCSQESYRDFKFLSLNGNQTVQLNQKEWGGDSEFLYPVFRFDLWIHLDSYQDANLFRMSLGNIDTIAVSLDTDGKITYRAMCYDRELGKVVSETAVPKGEWFSLTVYHNGTFDRNFESPTSNAWILLNGIEIGRSTQVLVPRRITRTTQLVGENFKGKIALFRNWNYVSTTPTLGTCLTVKTNRIVHDCDFDDFQASECGTLPSDVTHESEPSAFLNRFDIDLYVWTSQAQKSWYFPVHQETAQDALVSVALQRGMKRIYLNNYCVTPAVGTCFDEGLRRWEPKAISLLLKKAHAAGLKVFALYTDVGPIADVQLHNERAAKGTKVDGIVMEPFDGISMDFEPGFTEEGANSLFNALNITKTMANKLNIPVHASISWVWSTRNFFGVNANEFVLSALGKGDSIDIQPGSNWHCNYESRTRSTIQFAKSKGIKTYITLETRSDFESISFSSTGENSLWKQIRKSFQLDDKTTSPDGFVLHHYKQSINSGISSSNWTAVGMSPDCTDGSFDFKGVCSSIAKTDECGDGYCDPLRSESTSSCPQDCPTDGCDKISSRSVCESSYSVFESIAVVSESSTATSGSETEDKSESNSDASATSSTVLNSVLDPSASSSPRIVISAILAIASLMIVY
eukprot:TRINITY_DN519_c0_g1_i1.p1 TRINITY_DN519_c0_g1~~TRINITY_DN519_c0_g1_i1.p1  ORF type:complete len:680 (+),score=145.41 TRINITY_DN519_c0_g1_i1:193-2232(+)